MQDVARLAGVHRVTASVVLNNAAASTQVSEATRQRILDAAQELGYRPNAMALALRRRRTGTIGLYRNSGNMHDPFMGDVLTGLNAACFDHEMDLMLLTDQRRRPADEVYASLANGRVDGLITIPLPADAEIMQRLAGSHVPVVALADPTPNVPSVTVDDVTGSQLLVDHLAARGHRHVMYRHDPNHHASAMRRFAAFEAAARAYGIRITEVAPVDGYGDIGPEEIAWLAAPPAERPTAVAAWADTHAYRFLQYCEGAGIRVPGDVAVVGFDGIVGAIEPARTLTTIRAPWREVAVKAVALLLALIEGEEVPLETVFPVELVIGDTT